jgi:hypothetical protein
VRHVGLALAEEHLHHVRDAVVDVVLDEVEAVAHGEEVAQRDGVARVGRVGPLGHRGGCVEIEPAGAHHETHHGVQHRLGHGPAEQRRPGRHRRGRAVEVLQRALVALGHDPAPVDHHDGERGGERSLVVEDLVEQRLEIDSP